MLGRILVPIALAAVMLAGPPVVAQSKKAGSGCVQACTKCPDQDDCVSRCQRCWSRCSGKGHSVGYGFYCSRGCRSRTAQCWR